MAKHRNAAPTSTNARAAAAPAPPAAAGRPSDVLALAAVIACVVLGYMSRLALNPDGVSYLDLTAAMQRGDWTHFVQGYWSPLFPFVIGLIGRIAQLSGTALVPVSHAINALAAGAGVVVIWRWGRLTAAERPLFGWFALVAFLLCSAGLPRIEAVVPDVISLCIAICISYELLVHGGRRWLVTGLLLGVAFLSKTSAWPWLLVAVPIRLWAAPDSTARRGIWRSTGVCALVVLAWVVPLSMKTGRPTLGSSGRLNYSWYIDANTSRLPDGDLGANTAYREIPLGDGRQITVAIFDDADPWTYQPWGDPTAWAEHVLSDVGRKPTPGELFGYWLRTLGRVFGLWLMPMIVTAMVPTALLFRRSALWQEMMRPPRDALVVTLLGLTGLMQFVAIHAEPRLIAPYGMMLVLGVIWWTTAGPPDVRLSPQVRRILTWIGVVTALGFAVPKFVDGVQSMARLTDTTRRLDELKTGIERLVPGSPRVAIIGPAVPVLSTAYWSGTHIAMQIPPRSADLLATLPADQQNALLKSLFAGKVPLVWKTSADGGVQMLIVPPP